MQSFMLVNPKDQTFMHSTEIKVSGFILWSKYWNNECIGAASGQVISDLETDKKYLLTAGMTQV